MTGTPAGISDRAYRQGSRVQTILENAGYTELEPWWSWRSADDWTIDFVIQLAPPGVSPRTLNTSSIGVAGGVVDILTLRLPSMDNDHYTEQDAGRVAQQISQETGLDGWTHWRITGEFFGETQDIHIERDMNATPPEPLAAARQAAQAGDVFEQAVFDLGGV